MLDEAKTDDTRLPLTTPDPLAERAERLRELIPEAFVEGRVDFDRLRQALGDLVNEGRERYGLSWAGKADAIRAIQAPSVGTLKPCPQDSVNFATTENVFIEGDNLEVLKLLQKSYHGQVKMIYIDPPYNTGGEFIYPDNFREGLEEYLKYSGQVGEGNVRLSTNTETSGRYHSKWLDMMYPRLFLARNLLREDGVIFVSIDDHEVHNLRLMMDEIFGEENFIATIAWQRIYTVKNTAKHFSDMHEYVLVYGRNEEHVALTLLPRSEKQDDAYSNPDNDPRGPWKAIPLQARNFYSKGQYAIEKPSGSILDGPPVGTYWRYSEKKFREAVADRRIWWGQDGDNVPAIKGFLSEVKDGVTPTTLWLHTDAGSNAEGKNELRELFADQGELFITPKPRRLIERLLSVATTDQSGDIVLDFFAGSGTTADAVFSKNATTGGNRRFILVQLPEKMETTGRTLADFCLDRIRLAGKRLQEQEVGMLAEATSKKQDRGVRAFQLTTSSFKVWGADATSEGAATLDQQLRLFADHILPDRSEHDILYELILKAGLPLTAKVETTTVADQTAHSVADGLLVICLANPISQDCLRGLIALKPERILCLDAAFQGNDQLKTNTVLEMKSHGIEFRTV